MTLQEFYRETSGVSLMWMGNDGWVINLHGVIISTDLDLHSDICVPLPENVDIPHHHRGSIAKGGYAQ